MDYAPEWVYKTFGGLSEYDAFKEISKLHINKPPEGYELQIDMEKEPFKPTYLGSIPERHVAYEPIIEPSSVKEMRVDGSFPETTRPIKTRVYETQQYGISSWVQSKRTEEPKVSIGRWKSYYWYQWQEKL